MSEPTPEQQQLARTLVDLNRAFVQAYVDTVRPVAEAFNRDMVNMAEAVRRAQIENRKR